MGICEFMFSSAGGSGSEGVVGAGSEGVVVVEVLLTRGISFGSLACAEGGRGAAAEVIMMVVWTWQGEM